MPEYVFASLPLLASYSLCLAVGLGHSQSLPSHMVLGGQYQSLSNSQTFVIIAQREAILSTLSSIAIYGIILLLNIFFLVINQSINILYLLFSDEKFIENDSLLSLCCADAAKSMKMHHFHDRQCTLITWEVVVNDNNKEGVANQCNILANHCMDLSELTLQPTI